MGAALGPKKDSMDKPQVVLVTNSTIGNINQGTFVNNDGQIASPIGDGEPRVPWK